MRTHLARCGAESENAVGAAGQPAVVLPEQPFQALRQRGCQQGPALRRAAAAQLGCQRFGVHRFPRVLHAPPGRRQQQAQVVAEAHRARLPQLARHPILASQLEMQQMSGGDSARGVDGLGRLQAQRLGPFLVHQQLRLVKRGRLRNQ